MSQLQTQRTATFNTQQMIRFSQRMREKELNGELMRLDEVLEIFKKYGTKKLQVERFFKELDENDDPNYYDEDNDTEENVDGLELIGLLCFKYLPNLTLDELLNGSGKIIINATIFLEKHVSVASCLNTSTYDAIMTDYFSCIDLICNHIVQCLMTQTKFNNFELYSDFFLVILKFIWIYLKPYKQPDSPECVELQHNAITVINSILTKMSNLIETKLTHLTDVKNETSLTRLCKVFVYLIDYFKENSKSVALLWKVLQKLLNKNGLLKSPRLSGDERTRSILKKVFHVLHFRIYEQMKCVKIHFANLGLAPALHMSSTQQMSTSSQEVMKAIKFGSFLFKIFKHLLECYFNELCSNLNEHFLPMTLNLCSLINSIFLVEYTTIDTHFRESFCSQQQTQTKALTSKQYQVAKMEIFKDFANLYEALVSQLYEKTEFVNYLKSRPIELASLSENSEETLLFYCVTLNRTLHHNQLSETTSLLNDVINLLEASTVSIHLPGYVLKHAEFLAQFDFGKYLNLNYASGVVVQTEFYDFIHFCLSKYLLKLSQKNADSFGVHVYFLTSNILEFRRECKYRAKISYDLLLTIGVKLKSLDYLIFLCQIYEFDSSTNHNFKQLLVHLFESYSQDDDSLKKLEKHLIQTGYYRSYSILYKYVHESEMGNIFSLNALENCVNLYTKLIELIKSLSKTNTSEQIWIKKVITFIQTNNARNELLSVLANILNETTCWNEEAHEILQEKLIEFIQLDELNNLLKYFETARASEEDENTISSQTRQRLGLSLGNLNVIYLFISYTINIFKLLFKIKRSHVDKELIESNLKSNVMPVIDFLSKHCSIDFNEHSDLNKSLNLILTNIKLQAAHLVRVVLVESDIKDLILQKKFYDLFYTLLNDSNLSVKFFTLECFTDFTTNTMIINRLVRDLSRAEYESKEFFLCFIKKIPFNSSLNDYDMLMNRSIEHVRELQDLSKKNDPGNLMTSSQMNTQSENLDDTMNFLMSAMNSTMDGMEENINKIIDDCVESEVFKNDAQITLSKLKESFDNLQDLFDNVKDDHLKEWLKQKMNDFGENYTFFSVKNN
jgi:hypothetical protein